MVEKIFLEMDSVEGGIDLVCVVYLGFFFKFIFSGICLGWIVVLKVLIVRVVKLK